MQVLLLMASALDVPIPKSVIDGEFHTLPKEVRGRQQSIAEITEMIHVSLLFSSIYSCHVFVLMLDFQYSILMFYKFLQKNCNGFTRSLVLVNRLSFVCHTRWLASCTMMYWMMQKRGVALVH